MKLVVELAELMTAAGFAVTALDALGASKPRTFGGHRPDLVAEHLVVRTLVIGEAKVSEDLFSDRTLEQFASFGRVLVPQYPPTRAKLVVAVPDECTSDAWQALALAGVTRANVRVAEHTEDGWQITSRPPVGAASWRGSVLRTRHPN